MVFILSSPFDSLYLFPFVVIQNSTHFSSLRPACQGWSEAQQSRALAVCRGPGLCSKHPIKRLKSICIFTSRDPTPFSQSFGSEMLNKVLGAVSLSVSRRSHTCLSQLLESVYISSVIIPPPSSKHDTSTLLHCCFHIWFWFASRWPRHVHNPQLLCKSFLSCMATYICFKYQDFTSFGVRYYARCYNLCTSFLAKIYLLTLLYTPEVP